LDRRQLVVHPSQIVLPALQPVAKQLPLGATEGSLASLAAKKS